MIDDLESILRRRRVFEGRMPAGFKFKFDRDEANEGGQSPLASDNARTDPARQPDCERAGIGPTELSRIATRLNIAAP
jgi:hypothetical protein